MVSKPQKFILNFTLHTCIVGPDPEWREDWYQSCTRQEGNQKLLPPPPTHTHAHTWSLTHSLIHAHTHTQFKVEFQSTVPVQVDGEAWPQPPGVMTIERLPEQATMLLGPDKPIFSRALSKKEESTKIALVQSISQPDILLSGGLSSRRKRNSNTTPPDQEELIIPEES